MVALLVWWSSTMPTLVGVIGVAAISHFHSSRVPRGTDLRGVVRCFAVPDAGGRRLLYRLLCRLFVHIQAEPLYQFDTPLPDTAGDGGNDSYRNGGPLWGATQLRHHLGLFLSHFPALCHPPHAPCDVLDLLCGHRSSGCWLVPAIRRCAVSSGVGGSDARTDAQYQPAMGGSLGDLAPKGL